ncbi:MAG TPA: hypothetical protein VJM34_01950 [Novosphingobium sp.]|nr:hypothetical protein [Novosphingobium sp.]
MTYHALWLKGDEIVSEEEFTDLIEATQHVLAHLPDNRETVGVTSVRVIGHGRTCFSIE